jgi:CPA2 family monovalent cation:H+ antiporter-2
VENTELFRDILLVAAAALLGGAVAQALRLPIIIGFLVAGVAISPNTPGPVGNLEDIRHAADIGVILLMFGIGIELSFGQLLDYRRLTLIGGGGMIVLTLLLGAIFGLGIGLGSEEALVLGFLAANSSTVVAVKVLEGRQQLKTMPGIAAINICILQEIGAVLMVITVPSLGGAAFDVLDVLFAVAKGIGLIAVTVLLSTLVLPPLWRRIAHARSRELSLLSAIVLAVGLAAGSGLLGLSIAFGAFLAGLALSENEFGHATLAEVIPLRDVFASVFFLSMGMLIDPEVGWHEPATVLAILVLFIGGKAVTSTLAVRFAGLTLGHAILTAILLAQVGEFSFVIAQVALAENVIDDTLVSAFLLAAGLSIVVNPALVQLGPAIVGAAGRAPGLRGRMEVVDMQQAQEIEHLVRHVIICGYGVSASALVRSLHGRNLPFVIIDNNPFTFERVRQDEPDLPLIYGDATRPETLELARVREARAVAITFPNPEDSQITTRHAKAANRRIDVVVRGTFASHALLRRAEASEVVDPEFEASLEFVRHVLHRFGVDGREITAVQTRMRSEYYRAEE